MIADRMLYYPNVCAYGNVLTAAEINVLVLPFHGYETLAMRQTMGSSTSAQMAASRMSQCSPPWADVYCNDYVNGLQYTE